MLDSHGSYINDLKGKRYRHEISASEAVDLILKHADPVIWEMHLQQHSKMDHDDPNLMFNKTSIALRVENNIVECLYNHDGTYFIYNIELPCILEAAKNTNSLLDKKTALYRWCENKGLLGTVAKVQP